MNEVMIDYLWRCDLKNWVLLRVAGGSEFIQGEVVRDHRGRFTPGTYVYSTEINKKVGNWQDLAAPDDGRHVQTDGDTHFYPVGPGRVVDVTQAMADRIRSGQSVDEVLEEMANDHSSR